MSSTPLVAGEGRETLSIFPVDPSGNRGAPVEVEVDGCPSYRDGIDYLEPDPYPAPPRHVGTSSNAGCSLAREAAPRWTDGVAVSLLAAVMASIAHDDDRPGLDWGQIALECGFYDQSHFINDFKHFSGFTPERYASIHTQYQNYVPVG